LIDGPDCEAIKAFNSEFNSAYMHSRQARPSEEALKLPYGPEELEFAAREHWKFFVDPVFLLDEPGEPSSLARFLSLTSGPPLISAPTSCSVITP
jgi:hypothetical protein